MKGGFHTALVITPLKAIMTDQVKYLTDRGIKAVALTSDMTEPDITGEDCI
jgi:superfamily II DNA helicase RecQ